MRLLWLQYCAVFTAGLLPRSGFYLSKSYKTEPSSSYLATDNLCDSGSISQIDKALYSPDSIRSYVLYSYGRLSCTALTLVSGRISSHVGKACFLISFLFSDILTFIYSRFWFGIFERNTHLTFLKKSDILNYG